MSVLINEGAAAEDHILRRLAEAAAGVDIAADGAGTLLGQERLQVGMLADHLVAGREVQDDVGPCQRQVVAGRDRCPHVLADLHAELHAVAGDEYLRLGADVHGTACEVDVCRVQVLRRGKPALLVELAVAGQISFRHDAQQLSRLDDGSAVVEQAVDHHGQSHHGDDVELTGKVEQIHHALFRPVEQSLFTEQVLTRITRHTEFRQNHHLDALALGLSYQALNLLYIVLYVGHFHRRHGGGHLHKSVFHTFIFCTSFSINVYTSAGCSKKSFSWKACSL